ncbi:MAG: ECF transporter S component [Tissierellia bacterium]|nr:ECF transporter S component [Tissierellia bacterium]
MNKTKKLVVSAVLISSMLVLGMTRLGFIPVGPVYATTLHIPVLIAAICFGRKMGLVLGAFFGIYSLVNAFVRPTAISFIFQNPLVSVVPRILFPLVAYEIFALLQGLGEKRQRVFYHVGFGAMICAAIFSVYRAIQEPSFWSIFLPLIMVGFLLGFWWLSHNKNPLLGAASTAAFLGSLTNTLLVVGCMYLFYLKPYSLALGIDTAKAQGALLGIAIFHGLPEAVVGAVITGAMSLRKERYDFNR